jgi:hypothetical protein
MMGGVTRTSAQPNEPQPQGSERAVLIQQAFRPEWLTIAWMVVEALVAIGSGDAPAWVVG